MYKYVLCQSSVFSLFVTLSIRRDTIFVKYKNKIIVNLKDNMQKYESALLC